MQMNVKRPVCVPIWRKEKKPCICKSTQMRAGKEMDK